MKINFNAELNKEQVDYFLREYKQFAAPALSLLVAVLLFLFVLLPQIFSFSSKKSTADSENKKLSQLKDAENIAASTDVVTLSSNLSLSSGVLPSDKDFQSILNAISQAASDSNVSIKSYQFSNFQPSTMLLNYPSLTFSIDVDGSAAQVIQFIDSLYKKAPISEVTEFTGDGGSSSLTVLFYYKPFLPATETTNISVRKMNQTESNILNVISDWGVFSGVETGILPESTESAETSGSPF